MKNRSKLKKLLAIILSAIMVVLTINISTVSGYSNESSDNVQIVQEPQVNVIGTDENTASTDPTLENTKKNQGETKDLTEATTQEETQQEVQKPTEKDTEEPTQKETQGAPKKSNVESNDNITNNPILQIDSSNLWFRENENNVSEYSKDNNTWTPYTGRATITGTTTTNTITVVNGTHEITLSNVSIMTNACAFDIKGNSNVTITLSNDTNNTLKSGYENAGIHVEENASLLINSEYDSNETNQGELTVIGGDLGAGIGGEQRETVGEIIISGGIITATGGTYGAGIGSGNGGNGGKITIINQSQVTAKGGTLASGIGGGAFEGSGGEITIGGNSNVIAIGGGAHDNDYRYPSGIGSGGFYFPGTQHDPTSGATIKIGAKAVVTAISQGNSPAINNIGTITTPPGESEPANILQLDYKTQVSAGKETAVLDDNTKVVSFIPEVAYQSIAFNNSLNRETSYTVTLEGEIQQGIQEGKSMEVVKFKVDSGNIITKFENLQEVTSQLNPQLNIEESSVYFREENNENQYSIDNKNWITYIGEATIYGTGKTEKTNRITVLNGNHDIKLSNVNIDLSATDFACAFDIQSNSNVTLTLANNTTNKLKSGKGAAAIQVPIGTSVDITSEAKSNKSNMGKLSAEGGFRASGVGGFIRTKPFTEHVTPGKIVISGGNISAIAGKDAAGIGGTYSGDTSNNPIIIKGDAIVKATSPAPESNGAGIGSSQYSTTGKIEIKGNSNVTATGGQLGGAGIGSGGDTPVTKSHNEIIISENAKVVASGGKDAAGIGSAGGVEFSGIDSGKYGFSFNITINDNAEVLATGGQAGAGIGSGKSCDFDGTIQINGGNVTAEGGDVAPGIGAGYDYVISEAKIKISGGLVKAIGGKSAPGIGSGIGGADSVSFTFYNDAQIISISDGTTNAIDTTLYQSYHEENPIILQINYNTKVPAHNKTGLLFDGKEILSFAPSIVYQSIAFCGIDINKNYTVTLGQNIQQGQKENDLTTDFNVSSPGITTYTNVQGTEKNMNKVTFVDNETKDIIAEEYVISEGTATEPELPQLRSEEYQPDFNSDELKNITSDKTLEYKKVAKNLIVTPTLEFKNSLEITSDNKKTSTVEYNKVATATYTGEGKVIGYKINDQVVSVSDSNVYNFYVTETSTVEPIIEGESISPVYISVGTSSYSTEKNNETKLYFPIVATGYDSESELRYGVIRSTVKSDVSEENIEKYLADETNRTNINLVNEYTKTGVMNEDGRYNYVAVMPTDTKKTLYMQAWIEVDGVLYVSNLTETTSPSN